MANSDNINKDPADVEAESKFRTISLEVLIVVMLILMVFIYFSSRFFVIVPAGHKAVYFSTLAGGTATDRFYDEGLRFKFPWDGIIIYNARIQEHQDTVLVLTEDGLDVYAEISFRYLPNYLELGRLHKEIGPDYLKTILVPRISAITRDVISRYDVEKLYNTSRDSIQRIIGQQSQYQITDNYPINVVDVVIRSIILPSELLFAINSKLVYEQEMLEYEYRLGIERQEAIRKEIEGRGVKAFVDTSQVDILKWYGIKATQQLSSSENAKVVIIGTDSGELPVILGGNN